MTSQMPSDANKLTNPTQIVVPSNKKQFHQEYIYMTLSSEQEAKVFIKVDFAKLEQRPSFDLKPRSRLRKLPKIDIKQLIENYTPNKNRVNLQHVNFNSKNAKDWNKYKSEK